MYAKADEAWFTSTTICMVPHYALYNFQAVGDGKVGAGVSPVAGGVV